eukprot:4375557-Pyramimonas_sp.AAC.1
MICVRTCLRSPLPQRTAPPRAPPCARGAGGENHQGQCCTRVRSAAAPSARRPPAARARDPLPGRGAGVQASTQAGELSAGMEP